MSWLKAHKKNIIITALAILCGITFMSFVNYLKESAKERHIIEIQKFTVSTEKNYNLALGILQKDYIDFKDAEKACTLLKPFSPLGGGGDSDKLAILESDKYRHASALYHYAKAIVDFDNLKLDKQVSCDLALEGLRKIPSDYNGILADKINNFRNEVKKSKAENLRLRNALDELDKIEQETKVHIGDTGFKVLNIMGEPIRKNTTTTARGTREQWVYGNGTYIYLENGSVTSWQTSE